MRRFLLIVWSALAIGVGAQAADLEGKPIRSIELIPRAQPLPRATLDELIPLQPGEPLTSEAARDTLRVLFETGRYANLSLEAEETPDGVAVRILTDPNWFIGEVEVLGVPSPPTANQLVNETDLRLGQLYTPEKLSSARQNLRAILVENGFSAPSIRVETRREAESQQVDITFHVEPERRALFGELVLTGNAELTAEKVRDIAKWKRKKQVNEPRLEDGLAQVREELQEADFWQNKVRLIGRDYNADEGRIDLIVNIQTGPKVLVRVEGFDLSQKKIRRYVPVFEEGLLDEDLLVEGARNLRDFLQSKGYFDVRVSYERVRSNEDEVLVVYTVQPGPRQKLAELRIRGAYYFPEETIRERMLIQESSLQLRRGRFSQSLLERDVEAIEQLYRSNGFRDVEVVGRLNSTFEGKQGQLGVTIEIDEGPATLVDQLRVEGMQRFPLSPSSYRFASAEGQPFSEASVAVDRDLILAEYFDAGFQDAAFDWSVEPAEEGDRVIVHYEIREGRRLFVRNTLIDGLNHTDRELVEKQIVLQPDAPLSQSDMFESQRRLYDLGIFSKVEVALQNPQGEEPAKNVLFDLEESRRWTIGFGGGAEFARIGGGGVADVDSPIGEAAFSPRATVELTRLNLQGRGRTLTFRTRFSTLQQRALLTYESPRWTGSEKWKMILSALYDTSRNVRTYTGARAEGAFQLEHRLSRASTGLYRYTFRRTSIDQDSLQITPLLVPLAAQPVRAALLSGTYIRDRRDDPTDARRGSFNTVDLSFASSYWGSQPNFFRFLGQNSTYHRLTRKITLARTSQVGLMTPWSDLELLDTVNPMLFFDSAPDPRIPLAERFFSGGANSHRGFPFNQAGPRDPTTGFPIGGGAQLLNSVELRFPVVGENIGGVLFHDAGNVYSSPGDISFSGSQRRRITEDGRELFEFDYMVHAVGLGLRYRTPIGPVRVDVAYSINGPRFVGFSGTRQQLFAGEGTLRTQKVSAFQFHFSLGQTF